MIVFLTFLFMAISVLMILVVLVQRGRGGGLAGAFGGGGGGGSAFGTKTGDVFTVVTVVLFVGFLLMAIWLNFMYPPKKTATSGVTPSVTSPTTLPGTVTIPAANATTQPSLDITGKTTNVLNAPPSKDIAIPGAETPATTLPK